MAINALAALSSANTANTDRKTIADNFDAFLNLLTTQLKNQNPLDPLDTNDFTAQLVQFSGVEQSIKTNDNLASLLKLTSANSLTTAVGYIGKTVTAEGATVSLVNGLGTWSYTASEGSPEATFNVSDEFGHVVFTQKSPITEGTHNIIWDGKLANGTTAPQGAYTISISANDTSGNKVDISTAISGVVQTVDMTGSEPQITISGTKVNLSALKTVSQTP